MFGKIATVLGVGALMAARAAAQTDPGFPIQVSQQLGVAYGSNTVSPPGERIPRPETANPPTISLDSSSTTSRAVLLMVDLDVPRNNTRVQLLHWLATDITYANTALTIPAPAPVPYLQPSPPVGDTPHSYSFVLFPQPDNFSIPAQYANLSQNRIGFNVAQFVSDAGLSVVGALAGNFITVQNLTGSATMMFPPPRATGAPSSSSGNGTGLPEFQGAAGAGGVVSWVVGAVAVGAGVAAFAL
ncbi:hypothetical protein NX059_003374 [Plenodomus lindquistii]|nr:hypothetical protein NX059_003374 [Plenodomus lindquistii]